MSSANSRRKWKCASTKKNEDEIDTFGFGKNLFDMEETLAAALAKPSDAKHHAISKMAKGKTTNRSKGKSMDPKGIDTPKAKKDHSNLASAACQLALHSLYWPHIVMCSWYLMCTPMNIVESHTTNMERHAIMHLLASECYLCSGQDKVRQERAQQNAEECSQQSLPSSCYKGKSCRARRCKSEGHNVVCSV